MITSSVASTRRSRTELAATLGGVAGASVELRRLDGGAGGQQMALRGSLFFPGGAPSTLDSGAQIVVEDAGNGDAAIFDLSEATSPVPGAAAASCGDADAWKTKGTKVMYRNKSGALDAPACTTGSANGLSKLDYRTWSPTDVPFSIRTKRSTIAQPVGPLRVTLVLGPTSASGAAGECGVSSELACTGDASRLLCQ